MQYFQLNTIKRAIEHLQDYKANWLIPAFVFSANRVGTDDFVDMSKCLGTDQLLDRYFNGDLLGLPPFPSGNNLLRPRFKDMQWNSGEFAGDYVIRQDTKMWGNLFSSRGYREMRQRGEIVGQRAIVRLTDTFQPHFEAEISEDFCFEFFLVYLFAFKGFPNQIDGWDALLSHLLAEDLAIEEIPSPCRGRFKLTDPPILWPVVSSSRPTEAFLLENLAPSLQRYLREGGDGKRPDPMTTLPDDDPIYSIVGEGISTGQRLAFLLAGPPGTGKTRYARLLAEKITDSAPEQMLFLQFHPAIGYDDFMEGFRPEKVAQGTGIQYRLDDRLFLKFAQAATSSPDLTFVAVIDELNRGDVARVFGEVLTYLEPDYRGKEFTLPFSGKRVSLPRNLVLIATANPYDRSVTDLDDALLRRFFVIPLDPDEALLRSHLQSHDVHPSVLDRTVGVFRILNNRLPHGFGHTTFLGVRSLEDLASVWEGRVRMSLLRSFVHNRETFDATSIEIEGLLQASGEEQET